MRGGRGSSLACRGLLALAGLALAACSADGRQPLRGSASEGLVFVGRQGEGTDLFRVRLRDGAVRPLLETRDREELWPFWSQPAGLLVFQSRAPGSRDDRLLLLDPASGRLEPLGGPDGPRETWAAWSEDGARLAWVFSLRPQLDEVSGIDVLERVTGTRLRLVETRAPIRFFRPEFAPDGRRLVAQRSLGDDSTLWILEPDREPRALTGQNRWHEEKARFTRDGAWLVYTRRAGPGAPGELLRIRADGRDARIVARHPRADDHSPRPSPSRDELAFISDRDGNPEAYRVDLGGGPPVRLTHTPDRKEGVPVWSPDGERLALSLFRLGAGSEPGARDARVRVVDREGRTLLEIPGSMPDWMPAW